MLIDKRIRFLITSILLPIFLFSLSFIQKQNDKFIAISFLGMATLILFSWSLWEGLFKNLSLLTLVLPVYLSVSVAFFWFLLPASLFTHLTVTIIYAFLTYALCVTSNVFSVSAIRTIALYRAAKGVGFLLTLIVFFLSLDFLLSLKLNIIYLAIASFISSFPLFLQSYWTSTLQTTLDNKIVLYSLYASLIMAEMTIILYFWPLGLIVSSLFVTVMSYLVLGLGQASIEDRLFSQTAREYLTFGMVVFITMLLTTSWSGH